MRKLLTALGTLAALFLAAPFTAHVSAQTTGPTWVILVRHAEKAATPANDPPLTSAGEDRARTLAARLEYTRLSAIITTQFERTRATAAPTAATHHLQPTVVPATGADHVQAVVNEIRKHPGEIVLVVGHSNTVPAIVAALGAPAPAPICDEEYDSLYIVSVPASGPAAALRTGFGKPSPGPGCAAQK